MPIALLDVNVLFALAWADHVHHDAAHRWFDTQRPFGWATCPMTQCGFVRISSNPPLPSTPTSPSAALSLLNKIIAYPGHVFWRDDVSINDVMGAGQLTVRGYLQIADAYLIKLAMRNGGQFATFDMRAASLAVGDAQGVVHAIDAFSVPEK